MNEFIQVTVAINSEEGAHRIAEALVTKRLAASVWVSGPITSRYWWKGNVEQAEEWVCTAKTRKDLYYEVEQAMKEIHPYEDFVGECKKYWNGTIQGKSHQREPAEGGEPCRCIHENWEPFQKKQRVWREQLARKGPWPCGCVTR